MNAGEILWRPKIGHFSLNLAYFWPFWENIRNPDAIWPIGLFMQNDVVSEQYFLYDQTDNISV